MVPERIIINLRSIENSSPSGFHEKWLWKKQATEKFTAAFVTPRLVDTLSSKSRITRKIILPPAGTNQRLGDAGENQKAARESTTGIELTKRFTSAHS